MPLITRHVFLLAVSLLPLTACAQGRVPPVAPALDPTPSPETILPAIQTNATQSVETWQQLDLRYAHVIELTFAPLNESQFRFDVTLVHDDDGEAPQFADWWQVEDLTGDVLGMRILTHSHGTQPFARSETIAIPAGVELVIIRGHDMLHGFGGQAIQLNLITGEQVSFMTTP